MRPDLPPSAYVVMMSRCIGRPRRTRSTSWIRRRPELAFLITYMRAGEPALVGWPCVCAAGLQTRVLRVLGLADEGGTPASAESQSPPQVDRRRPARSRNMTREGALRNHSAARRRERGAAVHGKPAERGILPLEGCSSGRPGRGRTRWRRGAAPPYPPRHRAARAHAPRARCTAAVIAAGAQPPCCSPRGVRLRVRLGRRLRRGRCWRWRRNWWCNRSGRNWWCNRSGRNWWCNRGGRRSGRGRSRWRWCEWRGWRSGDRGSRWRSRRAIRRRDRARRRRIGAGVNHQRWPSRRSERSTLRVDIHECDCRPCRALRVSVLRPRALARSSHLKQAVRAHPAGLVLQALNRGLVVLAVREQPRGGRIRGDTADDHVRKRRRTQKDHVEITTLRSRREPQCRARREGAVHAGRSQGNLDDQQQARQRSPRAHEPIVHHMHARVADRRPCITSSRPALLCVGSPGASAAVAHQGNDRNNPLQSRSP